MTTERFRDFLHTTGIAGFLIACAVLYYQRYTKRLNAKMRLEDIYEQEENRKVLLELEEAKKMSSDLLAKYSAPIETRLENGILIEPDLWLVETITPNSHINPSGYTDGMVLLDTTTHNMMQGMCYTIFCFSLMGLAAGICLAMNLYFQVFGEKSLDLFPEWVKSKLLEYQTKLVISNTELLLWLLLSQSIVFLFCAFSYYYAPLPYNPYVLTTENQW